MRTILFISLMLSYAWGQDSLVTVNDSILETDVKTELPLTIQSDSASVEGVDTTSIMNDILAPGPMPISKYSLAILPLIEGEISQLLLINVDSIIQTEIRNNDLAEIAGNMEFSMWRGMDGQLCLSDSCLGQLGQATQLSHLLVWGISESSGIDQLSLSLLELKFPYLVHDSHIALSGQSEVIQLQIRRSIWKLLDKTPPAGYFEKVKVKPWYQWFTAVPNRYYLSGAGALILAWIIIQSDDEQPSDGIGLPPEWPQN